MKRSAIFMVLGLLAGLSAVLNVSCQSANQTPTIADFLGTYLNPPTPTPTPCSVANGVMGVTAVGATGLSSPATMYLNKFTSSSTASYVLSLVFHTTSPSGNFELGIYSDNAGTPGVLLADTLGQTIPASGPQTVTLASPLKISGNTNYWLAVLTSATFSENTNSTLTAEQAATIGTLPASYAGGAPGPKYQMTVYANICQ